MQSDFCSRSAVFIFFKLPTIGSLYLEMAMMEGDSGYRSPIIPEMHME
jgi:hypothetical protein